MYIKIKDYKKTVSTWSIFCMGLAMVIFLVVAFFILSNGISLFATILKDFLGSVQTQDGSFGLIMYILGICSILMIPAAFIGVIYYWNKNRQRWQSPDSVYALNFNDSGVIVYTKQKEYFLPYSETSLSIRGTVATSLASTGIHYPYPFLTEITLTFVQNNLQLQAHHQPTLKVLYGLVDLHSRFQNFSCKVFPLSKESFIEQSRADFLNEQIENQRLYKLHLQVECPSTVALVPFVLAGVEVFFLVQLFSLPKDDRILWWIFFVLALYCGVIGIGSAYILVREFSRQARLKVLRQKTR
jgi:hypothetical protein